MKILFFDYETSDLADFNKRARDPSQPHIASASATITDALGTVLENYEAIAKEDGWASCEKARETHGITHAESLAEGIDEADIVRTVLAMIKKVDLIVAFNATFDKFITRIAAGRFGLFTDADDAAWKALNVFCTMRPMTDICLIPKAKGSGWKFPKLQEAFQHITGKQLIGAHGATADNEANRTIYFWLKARETKH